MGRFGIKQIMKNLEIANVLDRSRLHYIKLVNDYNATTFRKSRDEYNSLLYILQILKKIVRLRLKEEYSHLYRLSISVILRSIPREFTQLGILANIGEVDIVSEFVSHCTKDDSNLSSLSKYIVISSRKGIGVTENVGFALPIMIAFRNCHMNTVDLLASRNIGAHCLINEFYENRLFEEKHPKKLKLYKFIKKYYAERQKYDNKTLIEKAVLLAYTIGYLDMTIYFIELDKNIQMFGGYCWRNLLTTSISDDNLRLLCYFIQAALYIDKLHINQFLSKDKSSVIGAHRAKLLKLIYLSGVSISLDWLLIMSDEDSHTYLKYYLDNPLSLKNSCRMYVRKHLRNIVHCGRSIIGAINELHFPMPLTSFLKLEDFIDLYLNVSD